MASLLDYGASISEQGIPVESASDDQKVLDTRWVTLDIFTEHTYTAIITCPTTAPGDGNTIGFNTNYVPIFSHNLGYLPAHDYIINSYSISDLSASVQFSVYADATNVYLIPVVGTVLKSFLLSISITTRVYTLPITNYYRAPFVQAQATTISGKLSYGVEFINPQFASPDISSATVGQYNFSTKLRPLNILQHGTYTIPGSFGSISITYDYPKKPLYLLAVYKPNGYNQFVIIPNPLIGSLSFQGSRGTMTTTTITVSGEQSSLSGSFAYILFKDPVDITQ